MNAVRLGMVTLFRPWEFLDLRGIKPEDRTRRQVNAAIRAKAAETGAPVRYLSRENKPAGRVDAGDRIKGLRMRIIDGAVIVRALGMGGFYAQLVLTRETTGPEQKIQICQGRRPEDRDGVLDEEQFGELVERMGVGDLSIRALWVNLGEEGPWASLGIGPTHDVALLEDGSAEGAEADLAFEHDGQQVVVLVP